MTQSKKIQSGSRKLLRAAGVTLLVLALSVIGTQPASATYSSSGFGSGLTYVNNFSYNAQWQGPMNTAIANWNATSTPVDIQKISGGNVISTGSSTASWYGLYTRYSTSFKIQLNSTKISADATSFSNFVTAVLVHEFGHAFYMADNPPVGATSSVMREDRNRNSSTMTTPKSYDISEVNNYM